MGSPGPPRAPTRPPGPAATRAAQRASRPERGPTAAPPLSASACPPFPTQFERKFSHWLANEKNPPEGQEKGEHNLRGPTTLSMGQVLATETPTEEEAQTPEPLFPGPSLQDRVLACKPVSLQRRPVESGRREGRQIPADIWDMILSYLHSLEDVLAFSQTCALFHVVVQSSRVWPILLDNSFGAGRSETIAQSRISLQSWRSGVRVSREDLDQARKAFYRRARAEFMKLWLLGRFNARHCPQWSAIQGREDILTDKRAKDLAPWFWGAEVITVPGTNDDVCVVLAEPRGKPTEKKKLNPNSDPGKSDEASASADNSAVSFVGKNVPSSWVQCTLQWKAVPVIPFDVFRLGQQVDIIARLISSESSSDILVAASAIRKSPANEE